VGPDRPRSSSPHPQYFVPGLIQPRVYNNSHFCVLLLECISLRQKTVSCWGFAPDPSGKLMTPRTPFLKQLRRVGVSTADLLTYYNSVIRSVLEYACPVWHTSLTAGQSQDIERLQKRALRCILGEVSYTEACSSLGLSSLSDRRDC